MSRPLPSTLVLALLVPVLAHAEAAPSAGPGSLDAVRAAVVSSMDRSADPCNDFYRYACGGWLDTNTLPADQPRWARSFSTVAERNREIVKTLLEDAAASPGPVGGERQQIGDLYAGCMDEAALDALGTKPLAPLLASLETVTTPETLMAAAGRLQLAGVAALFDGGALADFKDPRTYLHFLTQGGLGLPDRDYYVSDDPKKREILAAYEAHVARMLGFLGRDAATSAAQAQAIVAFESELAKASRPLPAMRQMEKLYNKLDRAGLEKLTPALPWARWFEAVGRPEIVSINVAVPEFFEALDRLAKASDAATLRAYLAWHVINAHADSLSEPIARANFEFYGRTINGQAEIQPRWKRCVATVDGLLGEAVGKLFVEREFAGDSKRVALELVDDVQAAFEANLPELAWMDDVTRARAAEKVRKVGDRIGYPDRWRDYSKVKIARGDFFGSVVAATRFEIERDLAKVGGPVDRAEWAMNAHRVNAAYNRSRNDMTFPAGILQPPFFSAAFPAAMNYGGIGAVIGHELTHGFDDQGRKADGDGVMREWWEPAVAAKFESAAACVADQYSQLEVEPGVRVDGRLTLGENIADLGGLKQAFDAYRLWKRRHGEPQPLVEGLSDEQLFFVSFGQLYCSHATPAFLRRQVTTDVHSPGRIRALGAPRNSPEFRAAFGCEQGDAMVAEPTCTVW